MKRIAFALFAAALVQLGASAAEPLAWPQFRGPNGSGISETAKPPVEFGPEKNLKFKVPVPSGASSPVVVGEKILLTAFDDNKLFTIAYSTKDGKELWRTEAPAKKIEAYHKTEGSPAASSVATDGKIIVSYFGSCGVFAYDMDGKQLWKHELPVAVTAADFGTGVSPILTNGLVILQRDETKEPKLMALDATDGSRKWETKRQSPTSYATPVVFKNGDKTEIVCAGYGRMVAYDITDGKETWSMTGMPSAVCTTPMVLDKVIVFAGWSPGDSEDKDFKMPSFDELLKQGDENKDGKISREESEKTFLKGFFDNNDTNKDGFITREEWEATLKYMSTGKNSAFAIKPTEKGEQKPLWKTTKGLPYVPTGIAYKGQLFLVKDGGLVTGIDLKTGKELFTQERSAANGRYYASLVAANGHIYSVTLDDGAVTVFKAGEASPEVVVKNPKLGERVFATPALADDTIYIRGAKHLWAFSEKK